MAMHHENEWGPRPERERGDEVHILGKKIEPFCPFLDGLVQTSAVKKSVATSTSMCVRMHSFHVVVFLRSGAGGMPWRFKMLPTV